MDADPAMNHWNLGAGDPAPAGLSDLGYGAEVRWSVAALGLVPGHSYRLYFMIHDGDQNRVGGDAGQGCLNITVVSAIGPASQTNCPGDTVVFNTIVSSGGTYTFSWLKNGNIHRDRQQPMRERDQQRHAGSEHLGERESLDEFGQMHRTKRQFHHSGERDRTV
jgi:hypothetical protein